MKSTIESRREETNLLEVYNTILLAIATLAVAWCSYQGTLWSGIQTFRLAESNKYGRLAQQTIIQSGQSKAMEEAMIIEFINAAYNADERKQNYILRGVRPELANILSQWVKMRPFENESAPRHPMMMPGYDSLMQKRMSEADKLSLQGQDLFTQAQQANLSSDTYSLLTVIFSAVMFLGAITTKLRRNNPRIILTLVSLLLCLGGLVIIFFKMPIATRG
jgi:hypothetical protein